MPCLTQLLASHSRILVLDAASLRVQVGLLGAGLPSIWEQSDEEAGRGLFRATDSVLTRAGTGLDGIDAFVFCEGPGSMLGTRTVAMALRTWHVLKPRPIFRYQSLALAGMAEWRRAPRALTLIADARRESWHVQAIELEGKIPRLDRRVTADLPDGQLLAPSGFRVWSKPPTRVTECSYTIADLLDAVSDADLFHAVDAPDAFQHEAPDYKKWLAQPHSAETAKAK